MTTKQVETVNALANKGFFFHTWATRRGQAVCVLSRVHDGKREFSTVLSDGSTI